MKDVIHAMTSPAPLAHSETSDTDSVAPRIARRWIAIGGGWLLYSLIKTALLQLAPNRGEHWTWYSTGLQVLSMGLFWTFVTPLVFTLAARWRPDRVGYVRAFAAHALTALALAAGATLVRQGTVRYLYPHEPVRLLVPFFALLDYHVITYTTLAVIGTALDRYREYTASRRRTLALLTQLAEARLQFLQRQLQPHFLFNALNTVAELTREAPALARRTLLNLARLLRSAMDHADDPEVTLREELSTLEPFIQIQRLRFSDSLDIGLDVDEHALAAYVPPMLLQPLIENAIRHGRAGRGERGSIMVVARVTGARLLLRVEDDGARWSGSFPKVLPQRGGHGIGLRNTVERLTQLYGADHSFALRLEHDGTTIAELDLPYRTVPAHPDAAAHAVAAPDPLEGRVQLGPEPGEFGVIVPLSGDAGAPVDYAEPPSDTDTAAAPMLSARAWGFIVLGWAFAGAYWMWQAWIVDRLYTGEPVAWTVGIVDLISAIVWTGLTPIVLWLARTVRLQRGRMAAAFAFHLVAAVCVAVVHLTLCFSVGVEDRALLHAMNVNPFILDLCIYFALLAWSHARDFTAWYEARGIFAARAEAAIARSRVETTAIALHAPFLLGVLTSAASLAGEHAEHAERVVERLADLVRAVLQSAEQGVRTVRDELMLLERCLEVHDEVAGARSEVCTSVDEATMGAYVPPGMGHAIMDHILARTLAVPGAAARVDVRHAGPARAREISIHVAPRPRAGFLIAEPASASQAV